MKQTLTAIFLFLACLASSQETMILKDIYPGDESSLDTDIKVVTSGSDIIFPASSDIASDLIWVTDGTTQGTRSITNQSFGTIKEMALLGRDIIFAGRSNGDEVIVLSNLDSTGQEILMGFSQGAIQELTPISDESAVLVLEDLGSISLWSVNSNTKQLQPLDTFEFDYVESLAEISSFGEFAVVAEQSTRSNPFPPFLSDGTIEGTMLLTEYLADIGFPDTATAALGVENQLVVRTNKRDIYLFDDTSFVEIPASGALRQVLSIKDKRLIFTQFDVYSYDVGTKDIEKLDADPNFFAEVGANSTHGFFINDDEFVSRYDPSDGSVEQISQQSIGSTNFDGFVKANDSFAFYWVEQFGGNELRAVNLRTLEDQLIDTVSITSGAIIVPEVHFLDGKMLYTKRTSELGMEWWVYQYDTQTTATKNHPPFEIVIKPNPVADLVTIEISKGVIDNLTILNSVGQEISKIHAVSQSQQRINLVGWRPGQYFIQIRNRVGHVIVKPIIKL